jgi:lysophospholipase L1-like esterase
MKGVLARLGAGVCVALFCACAGSSEDSETPAQGGSSSADGGGGQGGTPTGMGPGPSTGGAGGGEAGHGGSGTGGSGGPSVTECFLDDFVNPPTNGPNYDQFDPVVGTHCHGTNHQDITGVERVVFLGDSVTVGTPPTAMGDYYRSRVASGLATKFGLSGGGFLWQTVDPFQGKTIMQEDGDFASCSKWGARTDDLADPQLLDCFPEAKRGLRTLVIMTMGGNDLSNLTQAAIDGATDEALWEQTEAFVALQRDAVEWLREPGRFPNGVFVVFGNMYEFTDGTGEVESCDVSGLAGFDEPVPSPEALAEKVIWANEQFLQIAVDTGTDMIFMLEEFCGHGFNADNPAAPCYRGPGAEVWFDLTCIHPNPTGHQQLADMFMAVVDE